MHFLHSERSALFIDGANLYSASRNLGFDVDYRSLLEFFRHKRTFMRAYYYSALLDTEEYSPLKPLTDWLAYNGFSLVTKTGARVHRRHRPAPGQGQYGRRARGRHDGAGAPPRPRHPVQRRQRLPPPGRVRAAPGRAGDGDLLGAHLSRRWWRTSCGARPTSSSNSPTSRPNSPADWPTGLCGRRRACPNPRTTRSILHEVSGQPDAPPHRLSALPALADYRCANRAANPDWFNAPVPSFGAADARLLVVGLAPGVRGANRTGRPFTGDFAGVLLLHQTLAKIRPRGSGPTTPADDGCG